MSLHSTLVHNEKIRNIAIIAHVDHGKTTLVDTMFKQSGMFREGVEVEDRLMDNMDLEKERGITIAAKNCEVIWKDVKINILDTPGHADFGGEVERALSMVDGVVLLVDSSEGPLPQTRFVLSKALHAGLSIIVVINKIDRKDARIDEVHDEILNLLIELEANDDQLDFPLIYANGRDGIAKLSLEEESDNIHVLMDTIIDKIPSPSYCSKTPFQMRVADLSYSDYLGRLAIGRIHNGTVKNNDKLIYIDKDGNQNPLKVSKLQVYKGVNLQEVDSVEPGDIVILSGVKDVKIGDSICSADAPAALPRIMVDEPTVSMRFMPNSSPFVGRDGKFVQGSKLIERLRKETLGNVAIQVEEAEDNDGYIVKGRGEFQMAILIETMRREGYEMCVGRPEVIFKDKDGKRQEPIELLTVDCDENYTGVITEKLSIRKGRMLNYMTDTGGRTRLEFSVPSRSLIGYRDEFLTDTKGTGIMNSYFSGYEDYRGDFPTRTTGSLISNQQGNAVPYALFNLEPRGKMFVIPGAPVYEGMIIGEHSRDNDLDVNPCKTKQLSNVRSSGKDNAVVLTPVTPLTLEKALNIIKDDELVEVTPNSIRLRKRILAANQRKVISRK